jgi:hypothetical protein
MDIDSKKLEPDQIRSYYHQALGERIRNVRGEEATCLCPFHDDRVPSFSVNVASGLFNCHAGCGGGDIIEFERRLNGGGRQDARKRILEKIGMKSTRIVKRIYAFRGYRQVIVEHYSCARACGCDRTDKRHRIKRTPFWQRLTPNGSYVNGLATTERHAYRDEDFSARKGQDLLAVESPEDVNTLLDLGFRAISLKDPWPDVWFEKYFAGERANLRILPDNDVGGFKQAQSFAAKADQSGVFGGIYWIDPPSEWSKKFDPTKAVRILKWTRVEFERLLETGKEWREAKTGTPAKPSVRRNGQREQRPIPIDCLVLPDGRIAEVVESDGKVIFGVFYPGKNFIELRDCIEKDGQSYTPSSSSLIRGGALIIPPHSDFSKGEDPALFDDICEFVRKYWVGAANWTRTVVLYAMLTWVVHALNEVAYLRIVGDLGTAKSRFCDVLQVLCYRAVRAAGNITSGVLPRILTLYANSTLIVDEGDLCGESADEVRQILRCGSSRRTPVIKCVPGVRHGDWEPAAFSTFGPKVIATRKITKDDALETRCITEAVAQQKELGNVPISLPPEFWQEAAALRARLMAFRILNYGCTGEFRREIAEKEQEMVASGFDFRTAQLGAPLLALSVMLNHDSANQSCLRTLGHYDQSIRLERNQGLEGLISRYVESLREEGVTKMELGMFRSEFQKFAEQEEDYDPSFIPKKQGLSRRLNALAKILGIRLVERTSGHGDRLIVIQERSSQSSAPIPSVPPSPIDSGTGAERELFGEKTQSAGEKPIPAPSVGVTPVTENRDDF